MSLLDSFYKKYTIMNRSTADDPEGGWVSGWTAGATVEMALDAADIDSSDPTHIKAQCVQTDAEKCRRFMMAGGLRLK